MSAWGEARKMAAGRHAELVGPESGLVPAATLLSAAEKAAGLKRVACPRGDPLLDGAEAAYDQERGRIYYTRDLDPLTANYYIAHEFGHHWLDAAAACCHPEDMDCACPAEPTVSGVGDEDAYNPKERAEARANVFAREFLVPREKLRRVCAASPVTAEALASDLVVPVDLIMQQMADVLLLPLKKISPDATGSPTPTTVSGRRSRRPRGRGRCGPARAPGRRERSSGGSRTSSGRASPRRRSWPSPTRTSRPRT
jgi:DNA helicase II / ATP-dependent DNA helicase PcrA